MRRSLARRPLTTAPQLRSDVDRGREQIANVTEIPDGSKERRHDKEQTDHRDELAHMLLPSQSIADSLD